MMYMTVIFRPSLPPHPPLSFSSATDRSGASIVSDSRAEKTKVQLDERSISNEIQYCKAQTVF